MLKHALNSEQVTVVYSHVTLDEIFNISKAEYQQEHIDTLKELEAKYIEPLTQTLNNQSPEQVWRAHIEQKQSHADLGIIRLMEVNQLFNRKISGLPIDDNFAEINEKFKSSLGALLANCEAKLELIDVEILDEPFKKILHTCKIK